MTFISYAQNFEDVMLWRALKHVEEGFYIDVGANDPLIDSVTKAFYEKGWHGINIEPLKSHHSDLMKERPRDINLCCAAGDISGEIEVFECDIRGWATADQAVIAQHTSAGHVGVKHRVPMMTLADICRQHVVGDIHFLKVDVEGFEAQVLRGMDFTQFRPWIVVMEATRPNTTVEVHQQWEDSLLAANYLFAYADGINRFYISIEHRELAHKLKYPPNVFDEYTIVAHYQAEAKLQDESTRAHAAETRVREAETKLQDESARAHAAEERAQWLLNEWNAAKAKVDELNHKSHHWWTVAEQRNKELQAVYASGSWRITWPLRKIAPFIFRLFSLPIRLIFWLFRPLKLGLRWLAVKAMGFVLKRHDLSSRLLKIIDQHPTIKAHLLALAQSSGLISRCSFQNILHDQRSETVQPELSYLTPHAQSIYHDLKTAIALQHRENN